MCKPLSYKFNRAQTFFSLQRSLKYLQYSYHIRSDAYLKKVTKYDHRYGENFLGKAALLSTTYDIVHPHWSFKRYDCFLSYRNFMNINRDCFGNYIGVIKYHRNFICSVKTQLILLYARLA